MAPNALKCQKGHGWIRSSLPSSFSFTSSAETTSWLAGRSGYGPWPLPSPLTFQSLGLCHIGCQWHSFRLRRRGNQRQAGSGICLNPRTLSEPQMHRSDQSIAMIVWQAKITIENADRLSAEEVERMVRTRQQLRSGGEWAGFGMRVVRGTTVGIPGRHHVHVLHSFTEARAKGSCSNLCVCSCALGLSGARRGGVQSSRCAGTRSDNCTHCTRAICA